MEESIKNSKLPPKKKSFNLKNFPYLRRFNVSTNFKTLVGLLLLSTGLVFAVFLVQKPTNYKSGATNQISELVKGYNQKLKSMAGNATSAEVAIVAAQRKSLMLKLAKEDPHSFLEDVIDQETLDKLPQIAKDQIEKRQTLLGTASFIIEEYEKNDYEYYTLDEDATNKKYYISFTAPIPDITTGSRVKVDAYTLDDRAVSLSEISSVQLTQAKTLGASVGPFTRNLLAIRVLLSDNKTQGYDTTATLGYLFNYSYSAKAYNKETSFGIVNFTGTITPYFSVPYSQNEACTNYGGPVQTAINNAATAAGYNLSGYQHIAYLFPKGSGCPVAVGTVGSSPSTPYQQRSWYFNYSTIPNHIASIYAHELGHNLGMSHASSLKCGLKIIDTYSNCIHDEYGDSYDNLGYGYTYYPQVNAPHKYLSGYFAPSNVINVTQTGTYTIYPIETNTTSPQTIRIKKSTGDYYFLEYRRPLGVFDADLPASVINGATLYVGGNNSVVSGWDRKSHILDTTPGDTAGFANASFVDGRTFSDPASFLTIKQISHTTSSVTLSITYTPPTPTPTFTPTPTPKPTATPTPTVTPIPDNTLPTVSITSPSNGTFVEKTSNVTISANAADNIGISKVLFYINDNLECTDTTSPYTCGFKATGRLGSTFNIKATAYDKSNNTSSANITVTSN